MSIQEDTSYIFNACKLFVMSTVFPQFSQLDYALNYLLTAIVSITREEFNMNFQQHL